MTQLRIDNARVIDPENSVDEQRTLFIRDGKFSDSVDDSATTIDAQRAYCSTRLYRSLRTLKGTRLQVVKAP